MTMIRAWFAVRPTVLKLRAVAARWQVASKPD
jgi:hypothetical protein